MKPALLIATLLVLPGLARAQAPSPPPQPSPAPEIADDATPAAGSTALAPMLREKVNVTETESTEAMEIAPPADAPDPRKTGEATGKLPGDEETPERPPVTGTIEVDAKSNGKIVNTTVGNLIRITLESNPSTGYNWELRGFDYGAADYYGSEVIARKGGNVLFGAPADTAITLQAVRPGSQKIEAVYRRPWEPPDQVAATFGFQLEVKDQPATDAP